MSIHTLRPRPLFPLRFFTLPRLGVSLSGPMLALCLTVSGTPALAEEGQASNTESLLNQLTQDREAQGPAEAPAPTPPQPFPRPATSETASSAASAGTFRTAQAAPNSARAARSNDDDLDVILNRGTLRVGTTLFTPYAMRDAAGTLIGHEIDLALALSSDLGVDAEIVPLTDPELVEALTRGSIDIIIAAYAVTPARALRVTYTRPYAHQDLHLIASQQGAPRGRSVEDFNRDGVRVGVARGSAGERFAADLMPAATLVRFPEVQTAKSALLEGQVPVLLATTPFPEVLVAQSPDQYRLPLDAPLARTPLAFGIRGGNPDLLAYLDAWILARSMDRFLEKTDAYWIDSTDWLPRLTEAPRIDRIDATVR